MLTLIEFASHKTSPERESIDRDPGLITLTVALVRSVRRGIASVFAYARSAHQRANEAELFSSSSAWPYNHRAR